MEKHENNSQLLENQTIRDVFKLTVKHTIWYVLGFVQGQIMERYKTWKIHKRTEINPTGNQYLECKEKYISLYNSF